MPKGSLKSSGYSQAHQRATKPHFETILKDNLHFEGWLSLSQVAYS